MRFKLLDGPGTEGVSCGSDDGAAVVEKALSYLCGGGCFPRSVDAHEHDDNRYIAGLDEAVNRGIKIPVTRFKKGVKGTLECGFEYFGQFCSPAKAGANQSVSEAIDDGA